MTPHYEGERLTLHHGSCLDILADLPDASVDAVVTDPPYGLANTTPEKIAETVKRWMDGERDFLPGGKGFMGNPWDAFVPPAAVWDDCLRVLKPGGHVLAFAGSRTMDLMTLSLRLAGFDIRDSIAWLYGSGFPKSLDVSKAIDKAAGVEREVVGTKRGPGVAFLPGNHNGSGESADAWRESRVPNAPLDITAPTTDEARHWEGWGTALKPAFEPVVVARKPFSSTVAANVLEHGTGALNIDATRIGTEVIKQHGRSDGQSASMSGRNYAEPSGRAWVGRWPANVVLDESQAEALDQQSGNRPSGEVKPYRRSEDSDPMFRVGQDLTYTKPSDNGGASRYFFVAKQTPEDDSCPSPCTCTPNASSVSEDGANTAPSTADAGESSQRFMYTAKAPKSERPFYFRPTCECEDSWPVTASPVRDTAGTTSPASSSTSKCGSATTGDPSLTDSRSITSTGISSTTTPATFSPSPRPITSASTPAANSATENGGSPAATAQSSSASEPQTGTSAVRVGPSTGGAVPATSPKWSETSNCGSCGAPSRREAHATVKPLALMRWLVRLVTPPGGTVLEPFAGSGTTIEAALLEGFNVIGIEREAEYLPLIEARIARALATETDLFGGAA